MKKILLTVGFMVFAFQGVNSAAATAATDSLLDLSQFEAQNKVALTTIRTLPGHMYIDALMLPEKADILRRFDGLISNVLKYLPSSAPGSQLVPLALAAYEEAKRHTGHTSKLMLTPTEGVLTPKKDLGKSLKKRIAELEQFFSRRDACRKNIAALTTMVERENPTRVTEATRVVTTAQATFDLAFGNEERFVASTKTPAFVLLDKATKTLGGRAASKGGSVTISGRIKELEAMGDATARTPEQNTELSSYREALAALSTDDFATYVENGGLTKFAREGAARSLGIAQETLKGFSTESDDHKARLLAEQTELGEHLQKMDVLASQVRGKILRVLEELKTMRAGDKKVATIVSAKRALEVLEAGGISQAGPALGKKGRFFGAAKPMGELTADDIARVNAL